MKLSLPIKILYGLMSVLLIVSPALADERTDLLKRISDLTNQISATKNQESSLSSEISYLNNQIQLTQLQIQEKQEELNDKQTQLDSLNVDINGLSDRVANLQSDLNKLATVAVKRFRIDQAIQASAPFGASIIVGDFSSSADNMTYIQYLEQRDKKLFDTMDSIKLALGTQKATLQDKQTQVQALRDAIQSGKDALVTAQIKLSSQKSSKNQLLAITNGNEHTYQIQLAAAKASLARLSSFIRYATGGKIFPHYAPSDDSWGTYYNQSDSYWGLQIINSPPYSLTISSVGCTLTSLAMVYTHFGFTGFDPSVIASNSNNFWYSGVYWGPSAPPGHYPTQVGDFGNLQRYLPVNGSSRGDPTIIIGMNMPWGTHWIVLKYWDTSIGDFIVNDPGYQNATNRSFRSLGYNTSEIFSAWLYR